MDAQTKSLPGRGFVIAFTTVFLFAQLCFFLVTLLSMPIIKDTIDMSSPFRAAFMSFFGKYYLYACIIAAAVETIQFLIIARTFTAKRWPALITSITMLVNLIICILTFIGLYIIDLRNVYFTFQVTFLIPIISIFLSCVFMMDDTIDLLNNKFDTNISDITRNVQSRLGDRQEKIERQVKGSLRAAQNPNAEIVRVPKTETQVRAQDISSAAEKAVPNIK